MIVGRVNVEQTDVTRITVDFTPWLDIGEQLAAVSSIQSAVDLTGWSLAQIPATPPADPTPLQITSWSILPGLQQVQFVVSSGTPGNAYTITIVGVGVSGRRLTVEVGVQLTGTPPTVVGTPPNTVNQALAAQAAAATVMAAGAMPLAGGGFLGPVYVAADPTSPLQVADKRYADNLFAGVGALVAAETTRAEAAEAVLTASLATEVTNRNSAITTAVATETTRAEAAESTNATAITTEATNRTSAINAAIATEVTNRNSAISTAVATETSRAEAAEATNATAISTETTNRGTAITSAIATEVTNRNSAISTAVATETSRAEAAEATNATAISTETTRAEAAETVIDSLLMQSGSGRVVSLSAGATLTTGQVNSVVLCTGSGTFNVGLPNAASTPGAFLQFVCLSGATVTITSGSTQIAQVNKANASSFSLTTGVQGAALFQSINGTWLLIVGVIGGGGAGGGGSYDDGGACFLAFAKVTMADGSIKRIDQTQVGDKVMGRTTEVNTVLGLHRPSLGKRRVFVLNGAHITTEDHPYWTTKGPAAVSPDAIHAGWGGPPTRVLVADGHPVMMVNVGLTQKVQQLSIGDMAYFNGTPAPITSIEPLTLPSDTQLYNLVMGGSHTYRADGYAVTGWPREDDFDYTTWSVVSPTVVKE